MRWTADLVAQLRSLYPFNTAEVCAEIMGARTSQIHAKASELGIKKSAEFLASDMSGRVSRGHQHPSMIATRFQAGQVSWNKGTKGLAGVQEQCRATQFKKGATPHNTLPVGSYRLNKGGHLQQKIGNDKGSNSKRWRGVAELVWCAANGPLPPKHIVVFKRGMFTNKLEEITLDRVDCISNAEHVRRNSIWRNDPEVAKLYQLKGQITRQVNRIKRNTKEEINAKPTH
jgi:hypothetical protein